MSTIEFVLWLQGAMDIMGDNPTPQQFEAVRERLAETIGKLTADRILEKAGELVTAQRYSYTYPVSAITTSGAVSIGVAPTYQSNSTGTLTMTK